MARRNLSLHSLRLTAPRGFTLIELMVAIGIMALMAILSWRGLDGMTRAQSQLLTRSDEVLALQAGLGQWGADLDAIVQLPQVQPLDWDGRALRLTRRTPPVVQAQGDGTNAYADADTGRARPPIGLNEAVLVVAWTRREIDGAGQWLRWQSAPLRTRGEVAAAWAQAAQWAQNPGDEERRREVRIAPLTQWQVFYYRGDAWSNPLSSNGLPGPAAPGAPVAADVSLPEGVRLVLTLPSGQAISGAITRDWARPTLGGGKS